MSEILDLTRLGNPILRERMSELSIEAIASQKVQELVSNIRYTNQEKQYGVGLAAPQVGARLALSVIGIKPTPTRPELEPFESVIINPAYTGLGRRNSKVEMWEACQSIGLGDDILYGKVPRYEKISAEWLDERGVSHREVLGGFIAQVFQHEADHLQGVLFVDKIKDTTTLMMADEYRQRIAKVS